MKKNSLPILLLLLSIGIFIFAILRICMYISESKSNKKIMQEINNNIQFKNETNQNNFINFNELKEKNPDTVAVIELPGTDINYTVVQTDNNNFYLSHNFNKTKNSSGWIFADYRNTLDGNDKNIIIYGHNMRNGTMFSKLKNYLNSNWYEEEIHRKIYFSTPNSYCEYDIFSAYEIENENYYLKTNFTSDEFINYINIIKSRSKINFDVEINSNDSILTLSTCGSTNDYRIVLHAKKVNSF